mgnify:CR=1 FL=1
MSVFDFKTIEIKLRFDSITINKIAISKYDKIFAIVKLY